jgi:protein phosphatase
VQLAVAARTDVGRIRAGNEDSLYADATPSRGLFIVADGMGGHAAGEVASAMAVQIIARELDDLSGPVEEAVGRMDRALREANRAIFERTARESDKQGMGTTASVLVLAGASYLIGQVGDSRVYRLREGQLEQLTRDHSYVQEQVDAGLLTPSQAKYHPYSNVITRCVGANAAVEPDVFAGEVRAATSSSSPATGSPAWSTTAAPAAPRLARRPGPRRRRAHRRGQRRGRPRQHHGRARPRRRRRPRAERHARRRPDRRRLRGARRPRRRRPAARARGWLTG